MPQLFDQLREFLSEVENEKQASVKKRAAANTEPGSQGGDTSHPSKDVDDNTQPATEGKRSQENTSDVKKTIFNGGVDAAGDSSPSQEDQQFDVGITSASTGEDPASEDDYKSDKEDPGTSHPAKTNDGEKYGSMSFGELRKLASSKANDILSDITVNMKEAAGSKPMPAFIQKKIDEKKGKKAPAADCDKMAAAGAAAASLTTEQQDEFSKQAREVVAGSIEQTIADGLEKAAMVGSYLQAFYKAAEGEAAAPEEESSESPMEESAEHGEGGSESGMEVDPGMMAQMAGEDTGGGASPDDAAQELLMALQEQGIDPAELLAMIQQGGDGGAGGMPPEAGMMPPEAGMPPEAAKMASAQASVERDLTNLIKYAQSYRKAGKFRFSEAKTAQQRNLRDQIKLCVRDIIG
jgi:hypothetical protein